MCVDMVKPLSIHVCVSLLLGVDETVTSTADVVPAGGPAAGGGGLVKSIGAGVEDVGNVEELSVSVTDESGQTCHHATLTALPNAQLGLSLCISLSLSLSLSLSGVCVCACVCVILRALC